MRTPSLVVGMAFVIGISLLNPEPARSEATVDTPPRHGGLLRAARDLYLETSLSGGKLKIFPMTRELRPVPLDQVKITIEYRPPKEKKRTVKLTPNQDHFEGQLSPAKLKSFTLEISTEYKGAKERSTFDIVESTP